MPGPSAHPNRIVEHTTSQRQLRTLERHKQERERERYREREREADAHKLPTMTSALSNISRQIRLAHGLTHTQISGPTRDVVICLYYMVRISVRKPDMPPNKPSQETTPAWYVFKPLRRYQWGIAWRQPSTTLTISFVHPTAQSSSVHIACPSCRVNSSQFYDISFFLFFFFFFFFFFLSVFFCSFLWFFRNKDDTAFHNSK